MLRIFLIVVLSGLATSVYAGKDRIKLEYGRQRPGGDFTHYYVGSARKCARDCERNSRCQAFDYYESDHSCWLKNVAYGSRRYAGVVTGKKYNRSSERRSTVSTDIRFDYDTQRPGGDYTRFPVKNAQQCSQECSMQPRCAAFDFTTSDNYCYLKSWTPQARVYPGIISGTKRHYDSEVQSVQRFLAGERYNPGPIDGLMGRKTRIALENFQQDNHLRVTGRITDETLVAMGLRQPLRPKEKFSDRPAGSSSLISAKETTNEKASKGVTPYVKTTGVTYLQQADNIYAGILAKIPAGIILEVLSEEREWYKVSYQNQEGYVLAEAVEKQ